MKDPIGLIREPKRPVFDFSIPSYILDVNYHFVDWNAAFEEIVVSTAHLKLGMHAIEFVYKMENSKEVVTRVSSVFTVGKVPLVDTEPLLFKHPQYGVIRFQKFATQIRSASGDEHFWLVQLNISGADRLDELISAIAARLSSEVQWEIYGGAWDHIAQHLPSFQDALAQLNSWMQNRQALLVAGTGTGMGLAELMRPRQGLKTVLCEFNGLMRDYSLRRLSQAGVTWFAFPKQTPGVFSDLQDAGFDSAWTYDGLNRFRDLETGLKSLASKLQKKALFGFISFHKDSNIPTLIKTAKESMDSKLDADSFRISSEALNDLMGRSPMFFHKHSLDELKKSVEGAGFKILDWDTSVVEGQAVLCRAERK